MLAFVLKVIKVKEETWTEYDKSASLSHGFLGFPKED